MPRFFFDIHDTATTTDDIGHELPDVDAARIEAFRVLPRIAADEVPRKDNDHHQFAILVRDEDGRGVYAITLSLAGVRLSG